MTSYVCIAMLEDPPYSIYLAATEKEPEYWCAGLPLPAHLLYWDETESADIIVKTLVQALAQAGINGTPMGCFFTRPADIIRHFIQVRSLVSQDEPLTELPENLEFQDDEDRPYLTSHLDEDIELGRIESLWIVANESRYQESAINFRHLWQDYLNARLAYIFADPLSVSVFRSASYKRSLGSYVADYLGILSEKNWLTQSDYVFINEFLLAGDQSVYDGFVDAVQSNRYPEEIKQKALNL